MADFAFPHDLREAQRELHMVHAELAALGKTLPWSVEPHDGWARPEGYWHRSERPATTGWTDAQKSAVAALRSRALELSEAVSTHAFWATVEPGLVVEARMALKQGTQGDAGGEGPEAATAGA